jgi:hypothetical protein
MEAHALSDVPDAMQAAARSVLARDGRDHLLRSWQVAYLMAVSEGREGVVPVACGAGKGWLDARMREAIERLPADPDR